MLRDGLTKRSMIIAGVIVGLLILMPLLYYIYIAIERAGKTEVTFLAVPEDAALEINNQSIKTGSTFIKPGIYTLKASKPGFNDFERKVVVEEDQPMTVVAPLDPSSTEAQKWAEDNNQKYMEIEGQAGTAAQREGEAFRKKNPIIDSLPYSNFLYSIGYENDPSDPTENSIIVTIDAPSGYRNAAIRKIRELGHDPSQLKIVFRNYESPFENE